MFHVANICLKLITVVASEAFRGYDTIPPLYLKLFIHVSALLSSSESFMPLGLSTLEAVLIVSTQSLLNPIKSKAFFEYFSSMNLQALVLKASLSSLENISEIAWKILRVWVHPSNGLLFSFPFTSENANPHRLSYTAEDMAIAEILDSFYSPLVKEISQKKYIDRIFTLLESSNSEERNLCLTV